jgi:hypothetical protein
MSFSVDPYLSRTFHRVRSHCWHLTRDAWLELTGEDIGARIDDELGYAALAARFGSGTDGFEKLDGPRDPCLVMLTTPGRVPHCGVFYRGRLLQLARSGASWLPLEVATAGFSRVEFYR